MKTKLVRNIPVVGGNETLCTFTGMLSWEADMGKAHIHAGTFAFECEKAAHGLDTSKLEVDEDSNGGVFCLYLVGADEPEKKMSKKIVDTRH